MSGRQKVEENAAAGASRGRGVGVSPAEAVDINTVRTKSVEVAGVAGGQKMAAGHKQQKIGMKAGWRSWNGGERGRAGETRGDNGLQKTRRSGVKREWGAGQIALLLVAVIVVVGLVIWGIVVLILVLIGEPEEPDYAFGAEAAVNVQEQAQEVWREAIAKSEEAGLTSGESGVEAVSGYFDEQIARSKDEAEKIDLTLIEMAVLSANAQPAAVVEASARISLMDLDETQQGRYLGMLMNAYYNLGDYASGNYFAERLGALELDESEEGTE